MLSILQHRAGSGLHQRRRPDNDSYDSRIYHGDACSICGAGLPLVQRSCAVLGIGSGPSRATCCCCVAALVNLHRSHCMRFLQRRGPVLPAVVPSLESKTLRLFGVIIQVSASTSGQLPTMASGPSSVELGPLVGLPVVPETLGVRRALSTP